RSVPDRSLRAVRRRPRDRERLLGAERSRRSGGAFSRAARAQERGRRGSDAVRRRLHPRARIRLTADRGPRHRHRPPRHALHELSVDPRRAAVPVHASGKRLKNEDTRAKLAKSAKPEKIRRSRDSRKGANGAKEDKFLFFNTARSRARSVRERGLL